MYHRIEELNKHIIPQVQYLQSKGKLIPKENGDKVCGYFFPSMIFPTHVELISVTLLSRKQTEDKIISFATTKNGSDKPSVIQEHSLVHKAGQLYTTLRFQQPLILNPHQPFFFFHEQGELKESCIVLGYRNFTGQFGPKKVTKT